MLTWLRAYLALVGLVAMQRLAELVLSRRHERALRARGAFEVGTRHYPPMVALHSLFLVACVAEALHAERPPPAGVAIGALVVFAGAQALRVWAIRSLGERWTTRILVLPEAAPVVVGPYRFLRHPNYVAVILELAALPLVFGGWWTALLFSAANGVLLSVRIAAEERALGVSWRRAFRDRPRFHPADPSP